jgi:hypothetical protein
MKNFKTLIATVLLVGSFPFTANADFDYPRLPWYEKCFFPIGAWIPPDLACIPDSEDPSEPLLPHTWAEWNSRFAEINWDNYQNFGLDFAKFGCFYQPYRVGSPGYYQMVGKGRATYERRFHAETGHGEAGLIETNRIVLDELKDLNLRVFLWAGDMYWIHNDGYVALRRCFPSPCGGQGEDDVINLTPVWLYDYCTENPEYYTQIYAHYDSQSGPNTGWHYRGRSLANDGTYIYLGVIIGPYGDFAGMIDKYDNEGNLLDTYYVDDLPCFYIDIPGLAFGYTYGTGIEAESFGKIKAFFDEQ